MSGVESSPRARTLAITLLQTSDSGTHGALIEAAFAEVRRETIEVCIAKCDGVHDGVMYSIGPYTNIEIARGQQAIALGAIRSRDAIRALSGAPAAESGDETKDWAWAYRQLDARYQALRSECESADNDAPHPTRALAKLFAAAWNTRPDYIAHLAVSAGLVERRSDPGGDSWNITDLGKQALRLAEAP